MTTRLLVNGSIHTFNPAQPTAQAVAIQDGKILLTGANDEIKALADHNSTIEDLGGKTLIPALSDAHIHLLEYGLSLQRVDCETNTRAECLQRVGQRAAQTSPGKWVIGHGWNHNIWPKGIGDKQMLDDLSRDRPIYLTHKSLHSAWANSAALELAGVGDNSENPVDGCYQRDENGALTGILLESAMRVIEKVIPRPNQSERIEAILDAQKSLLKFGITSVHDFDPWDCFTTLQELENNGQLKLRVIKGIPLANLDEAIENGLKSGQGSDHLSIGWLKLFADGALGPQTAAMLEPFENSESNGMLFLTSDEIAAIGKKALAHGISLAVHAIGDRANREVIDGFAQLSKQGLQDNCPLPFRIEHVQIITPQDIKRLASLKITASMQPVHAPSDMNMADKYWGKRSRNAYAWQSVNASGAKLIFGSDAPVESPNPYWGIYAALTRKSLHPAKNSHSWFPEQRLRLENSLAAYITHPQAAAGKAARLGKIQPGYIADLVVLSQDPFKANDTDFLNTMPDAVMVDGDWIFQIN